MAPNRVKLGFDLALLKSSKRTGKEQAEPRLKPFIDCAKRLSYVFVGPLEKKSIGGGRVFRRRSITKGAPNRNKKI